MNPDILIIILSSIAPIIAAIIAVFTIFYLKKSHERTAMMDVFHMITDDHKNNEDTIIARYKDGTLKKIYANPTFQLQTKKVWRIYDEIGLLVSKGLIPKEEFLANCLYFL